MRFVPYDKKDIEGGIRKNSNNFKLLMEFHNSDLDCVKVEDYPQKSAYVCQNSLTYSIKRYHLNNIRAIVRGQNVYLIKEDI